MVFNSLRTLDAILRKLTKLSLVHKKVCRLLGVKPKYRPLMKRESKHNKSYTKIWIQKCILENCDYYVPVSAY